MKFTEIINNKGAQVELMLADGTWHTAMVVSYKYENPPSARGFYSRGDASNSNTVDVDWYDGRGCTIGRATLTFAQAEVVLRPSFAGRTLRVDEVDALEKKWKVPSDDVRALEALCRTARGEAAKIAAHEKREKELIDRVEQRTRELTTAHTERDVAIAQLTACAADLRAFAGKYVKVPG